MSIENVVLFTRAVCDKLALREQLAAIDDGREWLSIAWDAGFEFTLDEFARALGETLGRSVPIDRVVDEYRTAVGTMGARGVTRAMFRTFIGGVPRNCDAWAAGTALTPTPRDDDGSVK
jgi:hypothetical protein